jgi:hypothetical protein
VQRPVVGVIKGAQKVHQGAHRESSIGKLDLKLNALKLPLGKSGSGSFSRKKGEDGERKKYVGRLLKGRSRGISWQKTILAPIVKRQSIVVIKRA